MTFRPFALCLKFVPPVFNKIKFIHITNRLQNQQSGYRKGFSLKIEVGFLHVLLTTKNACLSEYICVYNLVRKKIPMKTLHRISLIVIFAILFNAPAQAQTERDNGIALYRKADYQNAVKLLKQATKKDANDAQAWYFLGLSYLRLDKNKESEKTLKKAVALDAANAKFRVAVAYVYLLTNKSGAAQNEASEALKINPNDAEAHYIIGVANFRNDSYNYAYERAKKAIELNPNFAGAYLLKSNALVSSFSAQAGTVVKAPNVRAQLLIEARDDLEKYLSLSPNAEGVEFEREKLESIKFFAE
jgi:Flp pilus assembly protein TadD